MARAFLTGYVPSEVVTVTYVVLMSLLPFFKCSPLILRYLLNQNVNITSKPAIILNGEPSEYFTSFFYAPCNVCFTYLLIISEPFICRMESSLSTVGSMVPVEPELGRRPMARFMMSILTPSLAKTPFEESLQLICCSTGTTATKTLVQSMRSCLSLRPIIIGLECNFSIRQSRIMIQMSPHPGLRHPMPSITLLL
jgi:hypothetical protein